LGKGNMKGNPPMARVCWIFNVTRAGFFTQHVDHMNSSFLLGQPSGGCSGNQVVRTSPHVNRHARGTDVYPQSSKKLTSPKSVGA
ncbi:MAG: hypothetical protein ACKPKO_08235, partial [Candidatus Fonsibacter sp.]